MTRHDITCPLTVRPLRQHSFDRNHILGDLIFDLNQKVNNIAEDGTTKILMLWLYIGMYCM